MGSIPWVVFQWTVVPMGSGLSPNTHGKVLSSCGAPFLALTICLLQRPKKHNIVTRDPSSALKGHDTALFPAQWGVRKNWIYVGNREHTL